MRTKEEIPIRESLSETIWYAGYHSGKETRIAYFAVRNGAGYSYVTAQEREAYFKPEEDVSEVVPVEAVQRLVDVSRQVLEMIDGFNLDYELEQAIRAIEAVLPAKEVMPSEP